MTTDDWGDPFELFGSEYEDLKNRVEGWLSGETNDEESDWEDWVALLFLAVTVATSLAVAADSAPAKAWKMAHVQIIRQIAATTAEGAALATEAGPPIATYGYGLTPQQVATLQSLLTSFRAEGLSEEEISSRIAAEAAALRALRVQAIAESELLSAHSGATVAAWRAAVEAGIIDSATKTWRARALGNICAICAELDGQTVILNDKFYTLNGDAYDAPIIHTRCRCRLEIKEVPMSNVSRSDTYTLPAAGQMTPETVPPALAAGMGPVARAFFASIWNALTMAGVAPGYALGCSRYFMSEAGFWQQTDGTWTRPEGWEAEQQEYAKYYEPSGVMRSDVQRAGKVLSAANAETLRKVCRGMDEHNRALAGLLESCGYPMEAGEDVAESVNSAKLLVQVARNEITGGEVTAWLSVSRDEKGKEVFDQHGTNFPLEILTRAVDEAALEGRQIGVNDEHGIPVDGVWSQLIVVTDEVANEILKNPLKRGLLGKAVVRSPELRADVKAGVKNAASIEGFARFGAPVKA